MKLSSYLIVVLALTFRPTDFIHAQGSNAIQAKLIDDKTNNPVPFATIRVMQGKLLLGGVISNGDGGFQISSRYTPVMDYIEISCIGYTTKILSKNQLSNDRVIVIKLKPTNVQLQEVVVSAHKRKLSANKIVAYAIHNISKNFPTDPFSYVAYYRDYQKEQNEYVNLNEAIVCIFDEGFNENDFSSTLIKLYQYRQNKDFQRDSITAMAYDGNNLNGNKFIPTATLSSFGGNELSLLRIHDAIRNYNTNSYSYVNVFNQDFIKNHAFQLEKPVYLNDIPLHHISFRSFYFVTGAEHFAKGEIFIEQGNYAIHKLIYATYLKESGQEKLLYSTQVEYARKDSLMYLNYISFNNFFKSKNEGFKVLDVLLDRAANSFIVTFNHPPDKISLLNPTNYDFKLEHKSFEIDHIALSEFNEKEAHVFFNKEDFNLSEKTSELAKKIQFNFKNIKDDKGKLVNEEAYEPVSQFRELFLQNLDQNPKPFTGSFIAKEMPLRENEIDSIDLSVSTYWMNTPLRGDSNGDVTNLFPDDIQSIKQAEPKLDLPGQSNIAPLEEKTYVQTDKPYYYPGERLWFKAFVNYRTPMLKDSLSRVLYVELLNAKGDIQLYSTLRIENGAANGNFSLPASLPPGNYFLRAYTNWMLNFGNDNIFEKCIPVLNLFERPEVTEVDTISSLNSGLTITPSKTTYEPREEVKLEIELKNPDGKTTGGDLSVSVTDLGQVSPLPKEETILADYPFDEMKNIYKADSSL